MLWKWVFDPKIVKNGPSKPLNWAKFWPEISVFGENNAWTLPRQLETMFEKSRKRFFWPPKLSKMTPENPQNKLIFDRKILNFGVIYQTLELEIHPKVYHLSSKRMPKHILKNFEKVQKRLFRPPKLQNTDVNLAKSVAFFGPFSVYELFSACWHQKL